MNFEAAIKSPATLKLYSGQLERLIQFAAEQDKEFDQAAGDWVLQRLLEFAKTGEVAREHPYPVPEDAEVHRGSWELYQVERLALSER